MAGCIDNVNFYNLTRLRVFDLNRSVFSKNGDTPFAFQVVGVQYSFSDYFIFMEDAGLL